MDIERYRTRIGTAGAMLGISLVSRGLTDLLAMSPKLSYVLGFLVGSGWMWAWRAAWRFDERRNTSITTTV